MMITLPADADQLYDQVQDESCPQVHSTLDAKWVSSMATSGTSTLRRGLESTSGFQICHNWFLVRTTFLTTFGGEHKHHFYSDAHADCDDHYDQELTTMALFDPVTGIFKRNKMVFY